MTLPPPPGMGTEPAGAGHTAHQDPGNSESAQLGPFCQSKVGRENQAQQDTGPVPLVLEKQAGSALASQ